jgi:hypothetical protein
MDATNLLCWNSYNMSLFNAYSLVSFMISKWQSLPFSETTGKNLIPYDLILIAGNLMPFLVKYMAHCSECSLGSGLMGTIPHPIWSPELYAWKRS